MYLEGFAGGKLLSKFQSGAAGNYRTIRSILRVAVLMACRARQDETLSYSAAPVQDVLKPG